MNYKYSTQTPNVLFDHLLKELTVSETKVLMIIIRRTMGMMSKKYIGKRVEKAWITQRLFSMLTGLAVRSVSEAINGLASRGLIAVYNETGKQVFTAKQRQTATKLYFSSKPLLEYKIKP